MGTHLYSMPPHPPPLPPELPTSSLYSNPTSPSPYLFSRCATVYIIIIPSGVLPESKISNRHDPDTVCYRKTQCDNLTPTLEQTLDVFEGWTGLHYHWRRKRGGKGGMCPPTFLTGGAMVCLCPPTFNPKF